jgi:ADP-ribose pyrophosphatase YjhB (NUDIX family)
MTTSPFLHCPQCCSGKIEFRDDKQLICLNCHFCYFHNVATAVGAVIRHGTEIMLAVRGRDPARGMLDLPGGFTDPGECLEQALQREMKEELGLQFGNPRYLFSFANTYVYAGVVYQTTDAIFEFRLKQKPVIVAADDVAAVRWIELQAVSLSEIAFDSIRRAIAQLQRQQGQQQQ